MDNQTKNRLISIVVAPYIQKATSLKGVPRKVGGNQFRHMLATFAILVDYNYTDPVLLKAALIHDLIEDYPGINQYEIVEIDSDGYLVWELVNEVSRIPGERKDVFLRRIVERGTVQAKILKVADRISNLTDMNSEIMKPPKIKSYLEETVTYILPMARAVNQDMVAEIDDLIRRRKKLINDGLDN